MLNDVRTVAKGWRWGRRPLVPRSAGPHMPVRDRREFPTDWARTPVARGAREVVQRLGLSPLLRAEVRLQVSGLDYLNAVEPPVIFIANHSSHLDTAVILDALPVPWRRRTTIAAAADYFFDVWWRAVGSALVFNTFPLERRTGMSANTIERLIDEKWNILFFPEGTRSPDGWARTFRPGAAYLAAGKNIPIVPIGVVGSFAAMPRGAGWVAKGRPIVRIRFGPAIHPQPDEEPRELGRRLQESVARLLDEEKTTWWSAARRASSGHTPPAEGPDVAQWRRLWAQTEPVRESEPAPSAWR
ncbi:MAG: 1-acyl-sn-glycerol-3-phosphate acyltransferase [Frankiales bacterium]|nr:1-acyl-sn-glycerol-3-phosphate acyltransferase [Frankiales bacterium]